MLRIGVYGLGSSVAGAGFRPYGLRFVGSGFGLSVEGKGFRIKGPGFGV